MYLTPTNNYCDKHGQQFTNREFFLILVQSKDKDIGKDNFSALVRKVAMRQCGHFMMGKARVFGQTLVLSGSYGGDGLPCTVDDAIFKKAIPVPYELFDAWNKGGGWNGAGSEAQLMREWAMKHVAGK